MTGPSKKINILINYYRSIVCLTAAVIFARLRWWGSFSFLFLSMQKSTKKRKRRAKSVFSEKRASLELHFSSIKSHIPAQFRARLQRAESPQKINSIFSRKMFPKIIVIVSLCVAMTAAASSPPWHYCGDIPAKNIDGSAVNRRALFRVMLFFKKKYREVKKLCLPFQGRRRVLKVRRLLPSPPRRPLRPDDALRRRRRGFPGRVVVSECCTFLDQKGCFWKKSNYFCFKKSSFCLEVGSDDRTTEEANEVSVPVYCNDEGDEADVLTDNLIFPWDVSRIFLILLKLRLPMPTKSERHSEINYSFQKTVIETFNLFLRQSVIVACSPWGI